MAKKKTRDSSQNQPDESILIFNNLDVKVGSSSKRGGNMPAARSVARVLVEDLQNEAVDFYNKLTKIFDKLETAKGAYQLDEINIEAEISADGKIGFLGSGAGVGAKGSISFKLVRTSGK